MPVNETRYLGEHSFSKLGRNSIFIEVMFIVLLIIHCFISLHSREDIKLMIVTFYNCDFKLCLDIFFVLELEINLGLLQVCYNFNYLIQSTKLILSTLLR